MKRIPFFVCLVVSLIVIGLTFSGVFADKDAPKETDRKEKSVETRDQPHQQSTVARQVRHAKQNITVNTVTYPGSVLSDNPSAGFDSLVADAEQLTDDEIEQQMESLRSKIDGDEYIDRANSNTLSDSERLQFKLLLRRKNALATVRAKRLVKKINQNSGLDDNNS